ncbi:MAG TPA: M50 family metallopeptidase [Gaiellaceae bacterium]|nr:M50 family metallopeptidase [Gaiellaceae bacterium]
MTWVVVVAGLVALVFIHELGHFGVALLVGMRPRSFYIGFPPAIAKIKRRGIEYGIGAIPLGGYVRLPGMHRPAARDLQILLAPAIEEQPSLAPAALRVRRALALEDFDAARAAYEELEEEVAAASLSASARRTASRALRDVEEGTASDAYWRAPTWKRVAVIAAGPAANVVVAFLILLVVYAVSGVSTTRSATQVAQVYPKTPAAAAGLRAGDVIRAIDGRRVDFGNTSTAIRSSGGQPITVTVERDGHLITLGPRAPVRRDHRWIWGFESLGKPTPYPVGKSARWAASDLWTITSGTVTGIAALFKSHSKSHLSTVVEISRYSAAALRVSVAWYFRILALVSMSLALLNLIPLLPLDGGHILFSLIESVRRRALAREVYERVSLVGIALIVLVFVIAFSSNPSGAVPH